MLGLQNVFFLFLLLCASQCMYGDNCSQSFGYVHTNSEVIENDVINQNAMRGNDLIDQSMMKTCTNSCKTSCTKHQKLSYYLFVADFVSSFINIPTNNVFSDSSTISSKYLAGRAAVYNTKNEKVGTCSASFLCMQNQEGIFTDISNYLSIANGLIISWFTPTTLRNLAEDTLVNSMVTECIVIASTKVGFNPFYGKKFNMIVSSDGGKIYFNLCQCR